MSNRFVISGLTTGDLLNIRVVAVNAGGRSEPVALAQPITVRETVGECLCTVRPACVGTDESEGRSLVTSQGLITSNTDYFMYVRVIYFEFIL